MVNKDNKEDVLQERLLHEVEAVHEYVKDIPDLKSDVQTVKEDVKDIKAELLVMKEAVKGHSREIAELKSEQ